MAEFALDEHQLRVTGILDEVAEGDLKARLAELVHGGAPAVKIDLSGVASINSASIGTLMATWIDLKTADRPMELVLSPQLNKILDSVGLTTLLGADS